MVQFKISAVVAALIFIVFLFLCPLSSADVADIDADVLDNVTFVSEGYEMVHNVDITWTATKSGYVYFMFYDYVCGEPGGTDVSISGNPVNIGQADTKPWPAGAPINVYRMGYVENGTEYSWSGIVKDDACGGCPDDNISYFPIISGYSGDRVAIHPTVSYTENECSGVKDYTALLLIEAPPPESTLYGYVTNNLDNPVSSATITLDNSGGETTSNDTGYYEITGISSGTYSITATSPTHEDYSDTVIMAGNTEKNITMTRLSPILTYTDSDTTVTDVYLFWKRNLVVDNVRIYKDTETRLLTTVGNGAYLSGMYSDKNLDCNKGYVYWLQPMDGSVAGPKYRVDAKTEPCTDGGGGGTDPDPIPDLNPVVTPGPTVPPEINMTQEEWLNLTLEEKQDVLANITLMAPVDRLLNPLLEFKWEDVLVWGIHLFLILCAVLALDSITTQKMSEYTGLFAIIPGVMFAYLGGYLVI